MNQSFNNATLCKTLFFFLFFFNGVGKFTSSPAGGSQATDKTPHL